MHTYIVIMHMQLCTHPHIMHKYCHRHIRRHMHTFIPIHMTYIGHRRTHTNIQMSVKAALLHPLYCNQRTY